ncbi:hypothetical protein BGZ65_009469 [Modicella reniformis]|uniref:Uncharacterized protein n=1 Tax=Modicella reniformis TaxID=1440133 RepID=A0A9P6M7C4_9FUNG|nr:hypothetical protein BGZ65_009469 [Modicella reniformis]
MGLATGNLGFSRKDQKKRFVGQVMIPGHHIVKAEIDCSHLQSANSQLQAAGRYTLDYLKG